MGPQGPLRYDVRSYINNYIKLIYKVSTTSVGLAQARPNNGIYGAENQCPCHSQASPTIPSFIGNDWYCESGNNEYNSWNFIPYMNNKLWDGQGCGSVELQCCQNKLPGINQPWFHKKLNVPTTDYIEIRICADQGNTDEDAMVTMYEFYIK